MPELPEVETVRDGLERHVLGRTVVGVEVRRDYSVRRHDGGPVDLAARLTGRRLEAAVRRGKFLWLLLDTGARQGDDGLLAHLGMSGQLLVRGPGPAAAPGPAGWVDHPHLRVRFALDDGSALDFVDQRTFGHLSVPDLVPTADGAPGGRGSPRAVVPAPVAHIARDLLDPALDRPALVDAVRSRRTELKRALLDQTLVSGIGNIYADEALWRARLHGARPTATLRRAEVTRVLDAAAEVMSEALAQGGTSFDALYVNVNGASGYFDRSLAVYGQEGRPCPRCGTPVRRDAFANRSSFSCPRCQPRPRRPRV
ncbi:bifunctional DNA-formamidopyrimidine glycosylase/DNA-(apurinic or apyrimidinic site) lyase [Cellulomonas sp. zg-ZUI199]|uniref:Formamidopyrimidine-DNA glycosylase n=1 Tax=Cellulomonas wangleii TaxID=2816956 RepID=A0ABX8D0Y7_9CELL|nr:bifunctional DNA-formamidopyrimidine glycosylase/DNA-(apurinic or apyrimidinic site) lyase [Cellulomonas wangleii]MBO0925364.1 bifunctional DNA-formamidopyrimidine glycosylase/DNA-(apurinic or apyrimidinic site) lyase [Cellulomonas wangleii]QVI61145.1 bifunctional DNA-formamidopyrimidine glycosylase/DNA-(apurinic or apyrimidinic site) lyase [Cellulomonas wangleii]